MEVATEAPAQAQEERAIWRQQDIAVGLGFFGLTIIRKTTHMR